MYLKPKGTRDIMPQDISVWQFMEDTAKKVVIEFNIKEIRTPTFEDAGLFMHLMGESSDIVNKEMYIFKDKENRSIALRPEGTASVVRACIENSEFNNAFPLKYWYLNNTFRYKKPQICRNREFSQFGVEYFGTKEPYFDVEIILIFKQILDSLQVTNYELQINSIGCPICRAEYNKAIQKFGQENEKELCEDCKRRMVQNPLKMLDCKNPSCQNILKKAPKLEDYLCDECKQHFQKVLSLLEETGVPYVINKNLVRSLDYYTKTIFEFVSIIDNKSLSIGGGGRYDNLVKEISDTDVPACGFSIDLDRLFFLINRDLINKPEIIYIANAGSISVDKVFPLAEILRKAGLIVEINLCNRSFKAQMKYADKIGARFLIIFGDNEIMEGNFTVRNLITGNECQVSGNNLVKYLTLNDEEIKYITKTY